MGQALKFRKNEFKDKLQQFQDRKIMEVDNAKQNIELELKL